MDDTGRGVACVVRRSVMFGRLLLPHAAACGLPGSAFWSAGGVPAQKNGPPCQAAKRRASASCLVERSCHGGSLPKANAKHLQGLTFR